MRRDIPVPVDDHIYSVQRAGQEMVVEGHVIVATFTPDRVLHGTVVTPVGFLARERLV